MIAPAVFYIIWDIYMTKAGAWAFNEIYITGIMLYNLPIEEVLFFIIVPYCCLFIYECIRCYFPFLKDSIVSKLALQGIAIILIAIAFVFNNKLYTFTTFLFAGIFILVLYLFRRFFSGFNGSAFIISFAIILVPFLIVNGFLTSLPVVTYNDAENTGIRIHTIPLEDIFYGMLLVMMNVVVYERLKSRSV
jgi:lycopene cyclase domain-containing protein